MGCNSSSFPVTISTDSQPSTILAFLLLLVVMFNIGMPLLMQSPLLAPSLSEIMFIISWLARSFGKLASEIVPIDISRFAIRINSNCVGLFLNTKLLFPTHQPLLFSCNLINSINQIKNETVTSDSTDIQWEGTVLIPQSFLHCSVANGLFLWINSTSML